MHDGFPEMPASNDVGSSLISATSAISSATGSESLWGSA
jgi:hypothetical protein